MRYLTCFLIATFLLSCNSSKEEENKNKKAKYDMYVPSEMSILMNEMYDYNLLLKKQILDGEIPYDFPLNFLEIHTAELSDFKSRNAVFQSFSSVFLEAEKEIFNRDSTIDLQERYNYAINVCISCHQTECTGPIPKIKKLLIQ